MSIYKHILVATDFGDECEKVVRKANSLANGSAKVSLIHVLEPLDSIYGGEAYGATAIQLQQIQDEINKNTESNLKAFGLKMGISEENLHLHVGHHTREIRQFAKENACDLIVVGSHGRHGLGLLMGSTANSILHGAECDVLAVRVDKNKA
jgi:universal stress protein A